MVIATEDKTVSIIVGSGLQTLIPLSLLKNIFIEKDIAPLVSGEKFDDAVSMFYMDMEKALHSFTIKQSLTSPSHVVSSQYPRSFWSIEKEKLIKDKRFI